MYYGFNTQKYVEEFPHLKARGPRMQAWLYALLAGVRYLIAQLAIFRTKTIREIRRNSQVVILEETLHLKFVTNAGFPQNIGPGILIYITDASELFPGVAPPLVIEQQPSVEVALIAEIPPAEAIAACLVAEINAQPDFIVNVQAGLQVDETALRACVDRYRFSGTTYEINYF